jgi:predicted acetyltransferase
VGESLTESVEIRRASYTEKSVLRQLLELYSYDFSEFDSTDVDEFGLFGYKYLDHYWAEEKRHPFLVLVAGRIAGFALIQEVERHGYPSSFFMAEFFIMKKYRSQGIGQIVAFYLFDLFKGEWSVSQIAENYPAQQFWRKVIARYTGGRFEEIQAEGWEGVIQTFNNRNKDSANGGGS